MYTSRDIYDYKYYYASDDIIIKDDDVKQHDTQTYVKQVEFTIRNKIVPTSELRLSFEIKMESAGKTGYARWYKNGVAYGTEQSVTGTAYVEKNEDVVPDLAINDTLEVWTRSDDLNEDIFVRNVRIEGTPSIFEQTV